MHFSRLLRSRWSSCAGLALGAVLYAAMAVLLVPDELEGPPAAAPGAPGAPEGMEPAALDVAVAAPAPPVARSAALEPAAAVPVSEPAAPKLVRPFNPRDYPELQQPSESAPPP